MFYKRFEHSRDLARNHQARRNELDIEKALANGTLSSAVYDHMIFGHEYVIGQFADEVAEPLGHDLASTYRAITDLTFCGLVDYKKEHVPTSPIFDGGIIRYYCKVEGGHGGGSDSVSPAHLDAHSI